MNTRFVTPILIVLVLVVALIGVIVFTDGREAPTPPMAGEDDENARQQKDIRPEKQRDRAPAFTLEDYQGNEVSLSDFAGKVVVLNAWATWCPFCVDELPDFARLQKEFADEIVVIAIDRRESLQKARAFTDQLGVTDGMLFLLDPRDSFYRSIGGFSMPETLFIDGEGFIRTHKRGPLPLEEMRERVQEILNT